LIAKFGCNVLNNIFNPIFHTHQIGGFISLHGFVKNLDKKIVPVIKNNIVPILLIYPKKTNQECVWNSLFITFHSPSTFRNESKSVKLLPVQFFSSSRTIAMVPIIPNLHLESWHIAPALASYGLTNNLWVKLPLLGNCSCVTLLHASFLSVDLGKKIMYTNNVNNTEQVTVVSKTNILIPVGLITKTFY
jgi:hypothetical protein